MKLNSPLFIVRGLPGSGKSTFSTRLMARLYGPDAKWGGSSGIFETDNFFVNRGTGEYVFDRDFHEMAHNWNIGEVFRFCRDFPNIVCIVANTFTTWKEVAPYRRIARMLDRPMYIVGIRTGHPSIHNVPESVMAVMRGRWERMVEQFIVENDSETDAVIGKIVQRVHSFH